MDTSKMTWRKMNDVLRNATEEEAANMLEAEKAGLNRPVFTARIFGRYNKLRQMRERREAASHKTGKR